MTRRVDRVYRDPLDVIWVETARRVGFRIERSAEVYASADGAGVIAIGESSTLDADDCLAQMVFHELCHALAQGEGGRDRPDYGLSNRDDRDLWREHACLRVQAHLAAKHGLRGFLAPTTEHRAFYDALPEDPLQGDAADVRLACEALSRSARSPFAPHLERALEATARVVAAARPFADARSLFGAGDAEPGALE